MIMCFQAVVLEKFIGQEDLILMEIRPMTAAMGTEKKIRQKWWLHRYLLQKEYRDVVVL